MQIRAPKSDLRSSGVPGALWGSILDGCLIIFGAMFRLFSDGFWTSQDDMLLIILMSLTRLLRHLVRYLERLVCCLPYACVYFVGIGLVRFRGGFRKGSFI